MSSSRFALFALFPSDGEATFDTTPRFRGLVGCSPSMVAGPSRKGLAMLLRYCRFSQYISLSLFFFFFRRGRAPREPAPRRPFLRWKRHWGLKNWAVSPVRYGRQRPSGREPPPLYTNQTTGLVPALSTARSLVPASDDTPCGFKGLRALPLLHGITTNS